MTAKLLYYTPPEPENKADVRQQKKARMIRALMIPMGVRVITVDERQTARTLRELLEQTGEMTADIKEEAPEVPCEILVFAGFTGKMLDQALISLRKKKIPVAVKAVVTESNINWRFCDLAGELLKEHAYMHQKTVNQDGYV